MTVKQLYREFKRMGLKNCEVLVYDDETNKNYEITEDILLRQISSKEDVAIIMINDTDFPSDEEDLY